MDDDVVSFLTTAPSGLNLTVAPAVGRATAPAVLVLPGGGYRMHADHEAEPVAHQLAGLGLHGVVLRYRLDGDPLESAEGDALAAMHWLRTEAAVAGVDTDRVAVLGFSAGGHLAGLLATGDDTPDLAVLCYPLTSFVDAAEQIDALLGMSIDAERRERLTLARRVGAGTCPMFVWHAADDQVVPVRQSLDLASTCVFENVPVELHVFERGGHGAGLGEGRPVGVWFNLCRAWFAGHGWLPEEAC